MIYLKLFWAVLVAFVLSMTCTWVLQDCLAEKEAKKLIARNFDEVYNQLSDTVNHRLVRQAYAVRDEVDAGWPTNCESLAALAKKMRITEIDLASTNGIIIASNVPEYIGFNYSNPIGDTRVMLTLLTSRDEVCRLFQLNAAKGLMRKYVGVWRPQGGFVELGFDLESITSLSRSSVIDLFTHWSVGEKGGIVVVADTGMIISDYQVPSRVGRQWKTPDDTFYWDKMDIEGFSVYVLIPKSAAAVHRNVLVGTTAISNGCALAFVAFLVAFVIGAFVRRQMKAQAEKDLAVAKEIQLSALPNVFPPFPDETRFDIHASMKTAKEVGGDFYDFYFTSDHTVAFLVADVSGKGVPAAMLMMRAKTLIKSAAQTGKPLAQVAAEVNNALAEGNDQCMFVTAWLGELNINTGLVTFVNCGHNHPIIKEADAPGRGGARYLRTKPGLALGVIPDFIYQAEELELMPGDAIYLYTDGVTEQPNAKGELFGDARLLELLSGTGARESANPAGRADSCPRLSEALDGILSAVRAHAHGVPQADDCTQLVLKYRGASSRRTWEFKPVMADLARATELLEAQLEDVPMREQSQLMVAADEIFSNIVKYSGATKWSLTVSRSHYPESVQLVFTDDGIPFDPLESRDPNTHLKVEERQEGGLGIFIVKKTMSPLTYKRRGGLNVLTMGKALTGV